MRRPRFLQKNKSIESIIHCLEEKYGDTFTYYNSDTQSFMSKYQEIWLRAVKLPKKMVQVLRDKYTGDLTDNYLGLLLKDDIQALLQRTAAQVFEGCLLFYTPGMAYTPLEGDTDARGFLRSPGAGSNATILLCHPPERKEEDLERFIAVLRAERFNMAFSLNYIDPAVFPLVTAENYKEYSTPLRASLLCRGFFHFTWPELTHVDWTDEHIRYKDCPGRRIKQ